MINKRQLEWVVKNRRERSSPTSIGVLATALSEKADSGSSLKEAVLQATADFVDESFRENCCWEEAGNGELVVLVRNPSWLGPIRSLWGTKLKEHLGRNCPKAGIRRVVFKVGTRGYPFPQKTQKDK